MHAVKIDCVVTEKEYVAPNILRVQFVPNKKFSFSPGQFISVVIPGALRKHKPGKRCYSLALNPRLSLQAGYEICVKLVKGGMGWGFLESLSPGDRFKAFAPFGTFKLNPKNARKNLCLISTGTGIGPFRSMLGSEELAACNYDNILLLHGVRFENELIYAKDFHRAGVQVRFIVSRPGHQWAGLKGRVTDLLKEVTRKLDVSKTDFYVCGNGEMVDEVCNLLVSAYGVPEKAVIRENFSAKGKKAA